MLSCASDQVIRSLVLRTGRLGYASKLNKPPTATILIRKNSYLEILLQLRIMSPLRKITKPQNVKCLLLIRTRHCLNQKFLFKNKIVKNLSLSILFLLTFLSCTTKLATTQTSELKEGVKANHQVPLQGGLVHTVFFWYADDVDQNLLAEFEKDLIELGKVPTISSYYYGPPAPTAARGPVDHSYDMAVNIFFKDLAAHDAYQVNPIHTGFLKKYKNLWKKIIVYDNQIH